MFITIFNPNTQMAVCHYKTEVNIDLYLDTIRRRCFEYEYGIDKRVNKDNKYIVENGGLDQFRFIFSPDEEERPWPANYDFESYNNDIYLRLWIPTRKQAHIHPISSIAEYKQSYPWYAKRRLNKKNYKKIH